MENFFETIVQVLEAGQAVELVSLLRAEGSTPRGAGAMLAVLEDGSIRGTIGGGNVEFEAQRLALSLLEQRACALRRLRFIQGDSGSGTVCGGDVTVHFQYLPAGGGAALEALRELTGEGDVWLLRRIGDDGRVSATGTADRRGCRHLAEPPAELPELLGERAVLRDGWFSVPAVRACRVYVFGGGHVSQALVPVLAGVGFRPVVCDDRPEFADPALFPMAAEVRRGDLAALAGQAEVTADDYVVIMTRSHQADYEVLGRVLRSGAKYIGCIGSRQKLALCRERLLADGFAEAEYGRVHAPIGLDIGAETPEEIAVAVTAELIAVRAGRETGRAARGAEK